MAYIAPIHRPSSVRHALQLQLIDDEEESLVLARTNRLEVWNVTSEGSLKMAYSLAVYGTISMIQKLRVIGSTTDLLFVGTDRQKYFTLQWNHDTRQLEQVQTFEDRAEVHMRDSQSQDRALVDPSGRYLCLHLWEGVISIFRLPQRKSTVANKTHTLQLMDQVRLSELFIKSSIFVPTETGHPTLAFLFQDDSETQSSRLAVYRLAKDDKDTQASQFNAIKDREFATDYADPGATFLIPVRKVEEGEKRHHVRNVQNAKAHMGGLIIVGETRMQYIDGRNYKDVQMALKEASIFVAWAEYDATHFFLADDYGTLHMLSLVCNGDEVQSIEIEPLGTTSRASNLVHLGDNKLFVASHYGDSQLYRVDFEAEAPLQLLDTMPNIAPILDFTVMDMGNREGDEGDVVGAEGEKVTDRQEVMGNAYSSGQARIVTGSGVHRDGTLRSVRSGVGLDDVGILADLEDVRALFWIKDYGADILVASFITETRVFKFDSEGGIEELGEYRDFELGRQTLLAANIRDRELLQVTTAEVTVLDLESGMRRDSWSPDAGKEITSASHNDCWLLLNVGGTLLVSLALYDLSQVKKQGIKAEEQVACVHAQPGSSNYGVVGLWCGTVSIMDLSSLHVTQSAELRRSEDEASIPRDLALVQVLPPNQSGPTLFVATEDGNVVTYNVTDIEDVEVFLTGRKTVVLGTRQASFHLLPQPSGLCNIFAASEHASLIHASEGRIVYSAVTAEDTVCVCPFDTAAYPGCIALATNRQIKIAQIDEERRTHVKPLAMGEVVRRLAYSSTEKVFGLGCISREVKEGEEIVNSSFKLVDEVVFQKLGKTFDLTPPAGITELVEAVTRAELRDAYGNTAERFLVGTSWMSDGVHTSDTRGRILVLGVDSERSPYLIMSRELKGSCRCIEVMDGDRIVMALTKTVVISQYNETSNTSAELVRLASYRAASYPIGLAVAGNMIAVADLMKSISLVEFVPAKEGKAHVLVQRARHQQSAWATAVSHVEGHSWLEADAHGNLMVLSQNKSAVTEEQRQKLEMTSEFNLGEQVNRIRKISVETVSNSVIVPKAFLGTVEGGVYMFGTVNAQYQDLLMRFQDLVAANVSVSGGIDFDEYRAYQNPERAGARPERFIDGELLERFLDLNEATQQDVCVGLGFDVEYMRNMVEELKRMH